MVSSGAGSTGYLSHLEEAALATMVRRLQSINKYVDRKEMLTIAKRRFQGNSRIAKLTSLSKKWMRAFAMRQGLVVKKTTSRTAAKQKTHCPSNVADWWALFQRVVVSHKIGADFTTGKVSTSDFLACVWNFDETHVRWCSSSRRVIVTRGHEPRHIEAASDTNIHVTLFEGVNMAGQFAPPFVIVSGKGPDDFKSVTKQRVQRRMLEVAVKEGGGVVKFSEKGSMLGAMLKEFFEYCAEFMDPSRNNLILYDGHSSHTESLEALEQASARGLVVLRLPPQMTDVLQPLDVGVFAAYKQRWSQAVSYLDDTFVEEGPVSIDAESAEADLDTELITAASPIRPKFDISLIARCQQITRSCIYQEVAPSVEEPGWNPPHDYTDVSFPTAPSSRIVRMAFEKTGLVAPVFDNEHYPMHLTKGSADALWSNATEVQERVFVGLRNGTLYPDEGCIRARGSELTSTSYKEYLREKQRKLFEKEDQRMRRKRAPRSRRRVESDTDETEDDTEDEAEDTQVGPTPRKRKHTVTETDPPAQPRRHRSIQKRYDELDLGPAKKSRRRKGGIYEMCCNDSAEGPAASAGTPTP